MLHLKRTVQKRILIILLISDLTGQIALPLLNSNDHNKEVTPPPSYKQITLQNDDSVEIAIDDDQTHIPLFTSKRVVISKSPSDDT